MKYVGIVSKNVLVLLFYLHHRQKNLLFLQISYNSAGRQNSLLGEIGP